MIPLRDVIPSRTTPYVTIGLIVVNVLVFLYESTLDERSLEAFVLYFGLVPAAFFALPFSHCSGARPERNWQKRAE